MFCHNCGKKNEESSKYCAYCGDVIEGHEIGFGKRKHVSFKERVALIFDFGEKKGFLEACLIYVIVLVMGLLLYAILPLSDAKEAGLYLLNTGMSFFALLIVSYLKGFKSTSWILALLAGAIGYMFGLYFGLVVIFYPLMKSKIIDNVLSDIDRKKIVYHTLGAGVIFYFLGILITAGSLTLADGGGKYTIFYGLMIYGLFSMIKAIYYCANPMSLDRQIEKTD